MMSFIDLLDLGMTILVPGVVWVLLGVGLFQLIRESVQPCDVHRQVARSTRS